MRDPKLNEWLLERDFVVLHEVEGRKSIAALVNPTAVCGIYVLHFANNQYYIGLAKNVTKRYVQHRQTHSDIQYISFKSVEVENLKRVESADIEFFKTRLRLRNIDEMEDFIMERDFDKLVDADFAQRFKQDLTYNDYTGVKYQNEGLQHNYKYRLFFQKLTQQPFYGELLAMCKLYTERCLPAPLKTEYAFWSVTCFRIKPQSVVIRLNIHRQEVFTVFLTTLNSGKQTLDFRFQLAKKPLTQIVNGKTAQKNIEQQCASAEFTDFFYPTGGKDQLRLMALAKDARRLFSFPSFVEATRLHNLRLMHKGTSFNKTSHCMDLAEKMLAFGQNGTA